MKTKKLKARRMWANYYREGAPVFFTHKNVALRCANEDAIVSHVPVAVIPLDDVDLMIDKAFLAFGGLPYSRGAVRAALVAIGVLPKRKGRK